MRPFRSILKLLAAVLDGSNVTILAIDGKHQSIARAGIDNEVVTRLCDTKGGQRRRREGGRGQQSGFEKHDV